MAQRRLSIITVHGTWPYGFFRNGPKGKKIYWFEASSSFSVGLQKILKTYLIESDIHTFRWTGDNTLYSRNEAQKNLSNFTTEIKKKDPSNLIIIVAHSHGGNIALAASQKEGTSVNAICTMATPFIHIKSETLLSQFDQSNIAYLLIICLLYAGSIISESTLITFLTVILTVFAAWLSIKLLPYLKDDQLQLQNTQKFLCSQRQNIGNPFPILAAQGTGDLATALLSFAVSASRFYNKFTYLIYNTIRPKLYYAIGLSLIATAVLNFLDVIKFIDIHFTIMLPFIFLSIGYLSVLAPRYFLRAFAGFELLSPRLSCEVDISEIPTNQQNVKQHKLDASPRFNSISHNAYDHPDIIPVIGRWIESLLCEDT